MDNWHFNKWCEKAVSGIVFPPDRWNVAMELRDHMQDHCADLMEQGYDEPTARDLTLKAMGDVDEIARQLAAIHRPFWGYFLRATRRILVLLLIITVIPFICFILKPTYSQPENLWYGYDPYTDTHLSDEGAVSTRIMYGEPKQQFKSDGYTLELTRAAWIYTDFTDEAKVDMDLLCFQIEITNSLPWAEEPDIRQWIWAQDSEGNTYAPWCSAVPGKHLLGQIYHSAPFTWTLEMLTNDFCSQNADWIDICYSRDGRQFRFRIDLPGGDAQ